MDFNWDAIKAITILGVPLVTLSIAFLAIIISLLMRKLVSHLIIKRLNKIAARTEGKFDDMLIHALEGPLRLTVLAIGLYVARLILAPYLKIVEVQINQAFQILFLIIISFLIYRGTDLFIYYLEKLASRTRTELDDLLLPYLKKVIRVFLVLLVILKIAEVLLGMSMAALLGLLGGVGLTLGLVFKDLVSNWFGCAIIYLDKLFKEGDWVSLDNGSIVDADVEEIGLRSTKFRNFDKTVSIVPNSIIASAVVKNWSRMYKRRVKYNFKVDGVSAAKMEQLLQGIKNILTNDSDVHQEFHMVNFRELDGNSRVIRLYYFTKTTVWAEHEQVRENINLKLLRLFEDLGIDKLAYTIVDLSDDRPVDFSEEVENSRN